MPDREPAWVYCALVTFTTLVFPRKPYWFGNVEFSPLDWDPPDCAEAMKQSISLHDIADPSQTPHQFWRARMLVLDVTLEDVVATGKAAIRETVDLFLEHCLCRVGGQVMDAGYVQNLKSGRVSPLLPPHSYQGLPITGAFTDLQATHPSYVLNHLLAAGPDALGELGSAVRRSSHWRQLSKMTEDDGEQFLLAWMGAECLCRVDRDEPMTPKFRALLGFPSQALAQALSTPEVQKIIKTERYGRWRHVVTHVFEALRDARNAIAHNGFRRIDLKLGRLEAEMAKQLMPMVAKLAASMGLLALANGETTITGMWNAYPRDLNAIGVPRHIEWVLGRLDAIENSAQSK